MNADRHHLLPRLRDVDLSSEVPPPSREEAARLRERAEREFIPDAVDRVKLRGIPAIGGRGSLGGAIKGSRPDHLDWLDERQRRNRRRRRSL